MITVMTMQVVIGTVLEGYQTLARIASQQTFKPNQKIQQVSASGIARLNCTSAASDRQTKCPPCTENAQRLQENVRKAQHNMR